MGVTGIEKYKMRSPTLLPYMRNGLINKFVKKISEQAGWTEPVVRTRNKRGIPVITYIRDEKTKRHYRFCDMVTSHTMRRTAITTMLCLGMNEQMVRKISGHAPNSKEFYRYVTYAQSYIDKEIDMVHEKLSAIATSK